MNCRQAAPGAPRSRDVADGPVHPGQAPGTRDAFTGSDSSAAPNPPVRQALGDGGSGGPAAAGDQARGPGSRVWAPNTGTATTLSCESGAS